MTIEQFRDRTIDYVRQRIAEYESPQSNPTATRQSAVAVEPWKQLLDEMESAGVERVGELPDERSEHYFHATRSEIGQVPVAETLNRFLGLAEKQRDEAD